MHLATSRYSADDRHHIAAEQAFILHPDSNITAQSCSCRSEHLNRVEGIKRFLDGHHAYKQVSIDRRPECISCIIDCIHKHCATKRFHACLSDSNHTVLHHYLPLHIIPCKLVIDQLFHSGIENKIDVFRYLDHSQRGSIIVSV